MSGPAIVVRTATTADIPVILEIDRSATFKYGTVPELAFLTEEDGVSSEAVQNWLDKGTIYVATTRPDDAGNNEEVVVGFAVTQPLDNHLYLAELGVHAEHQRRGVGALLIQTVFKEARSKKKTKVTLATYPNLSWTGPWYKKHGFRQTDPTTLGAEHVYKATKDEAEQHLVRPGYPRCIMVWDDGSYL